MKFVIGNLKMVMVVFMDWVGVISVYVLVVLLLYRISVFFMMLYGFVMGIINCGFVWFFWVLFLVRLLSIFVKFLVVYELNFLGLIKW